jgi:hypothetical protein
MKTHLKLLRMSAAALLGAAADLIASKDPNKPIGKYIWQDL